MTDAETIKALEYCSKQGITSECEKCTVGNGCRSELIISALDLINRQKAEIERLQKENNRFADLGKMYSEIKGEAIKEFAERLKECKHECGCNYRKKPVYAVTEEKIDNLVKEMAGDTE